MTNEEYKERLTIASEELQLQFDSVINNSLLEAEKLKKDTMFTSSEAYGLIIWVLAKLAVDGKVKIVTGGD